jgi:DNA end-binding protein Ku
MRSSIWKGTISFGLLHVPVSLQTAQEEKELHFSLLDGKTLSPIHFKRVSAATGKEVPYSQIVKAYKDKSGRYVVLSDRDFQAANVKSTQTIEIADFVPLAEIDPLLFDRPYYLVPGKNGEKGYFLLRDALAKTGKVAVGKVVIRTKQHLALVMPRGEYLVLELLRFANEVLEAHEVDYLKGVKRRKYGAKELRMAEALIQSMTGEWDPDKYKDTYREDLMKRVREKLEAGEAETVAEEAPKPEPEEAPQVVDLLPLLKESLAEVQPKARRRKKAS